MSVNHNLWRDQQLQGFKKLANSTPILEQELVMLNFVKQYPKVIWRWLAPQTKFKELSNLNLSNTNYTGVIVFGPIIENLTSSQLVNKIKQLTNNVKYAYIGINRYQVIANDLEILLPDNIADSLDIIMNYCNPLFKRLHTFKQVDGNHMVAAHPMDCYVLCQ